MTSVQTRSSKMEEVEKDVGAPKESVETVPDSITNMTSSQANNPTLTKLEKFITEMMLWKTPWINLSMRWEFQLLPIIRENPRTPIMGFL